MRASSMIRGVSLMVAIAVATATATVSFPQDAKAVVVRSGTTRTIFPSDYNQTVVVESNATLYIVPHPSQPAAPVPLANLTVKSGGRVTHMGADYEGKMSFGLSPDGESRYVDSVLAPTEANNRWIGYVRPTAVVAGQTQKPQLFCFQAYPVVPQTMERTSTSTSEGILNLYKLDRTNPRPFTGQRMTPKYTATLFRLSSGGENHDVTVSCYDSLDEQDVYQIEALNPFHDSPNAGSTPPGFGYDFIALIGDLTTASGTDGRTSRAIDPNVYLLRDSNGLSDYRLTAKDSYVASSFITNEYSPDSPHGLAHWVYPYGTTWEYIQTENVPLTKGLRNGKTNFYQHSLSASQARIREAFPRVTAGINLDIRGALTVENGGRIDVSGKGYPGVPRYMNAGSTYYSVAGGPGGGLSGVDDGNCSDWWNGGGGGHIGRGRGLLVKAEGNLDPANRRSRPAAYDSSSTLLGSGGGSGFDEDRTFPSYNCTSEHRFGGAGGGSIRIKAGTAALSGGALILAKGGDRRGSEQNQAGGGAGGSILMEVLHWQLPTYNGSAAAAARVKAGIGEYETSGLYVDDYGVTRHIGDWVNLSTEKASGRDETGIGTFSERSGDKAKIQSPPQAEDGRISLPSEVRNNDGRFTGLSLPQFDASGGDGGGGGGLIELGQATTEEQWIDVTTLERKPDGGKVPLTNCYVAWQYGASENPPQHVDGVGKYRITVESAKLGDYRVNASCEGYRLVEPVSTPVTVPMLVGKKTSQDFVFVRDTRVLSMLQASIDSPINGYKYNLQREGIIELLGSALYSGSPSEVSKAELTITNGSTSTVLQYVDKSFQPATGQYRFTFGTWRATVAGAYTAVLRVAMENGTTATDFCLFYVTDSGRVLNYGVGSRAF